jgi:hypothetical protein
VEDTIMRPFAAVRTLPFLFTAAIAFGAASPGVAQERPALEATAGWAGFVDDATIHHKVIGGAVRFPISPRVSLTPEVVYMVGPGSDRDWMMTGNVVVDFVPKGRVEPYVLAGAGLIRTTQPTGVGPYTSSEGAFTAGAGTRVWLGRMIYVAPEWRLGWELHQRITVALGVRFGT